MNALKELTRNLKIRVEDPDQLDEDDAPQFCLLGHHQCVEVHDNRKFATMPGNHRGSVAIHGFHHPMQGALYVSMRIKKARKCVYIDLYVRCIAIPSITVHPLTTWIRH